MPGGSAGWLLYKAAKSSTFGYKNGSNRRTGFDEALVDAWTEQRPAVLERYVGREIIEELREG
jgi:hypothetical protein